METKKFELKNLLKDKKFWVASFLITWAAALQGHMMWLKRQDSFQQKFGTIPDENINKQQDKSTDSQHSVESAVIFDEVLKIARESFVILFEGESTWSALRRLVDPSQL